MNEAPVTHPSLLVRLRDRSDEQAWCEFTEIYGPLAYQLAKRRGLQEADAQDLVQEVLAPSPGRSRRLTRTLHRGSFRGWLSRIASNLIINIFVAQRRHPRGSGETDMVRLMEEQPDESCEESALFEQEYRRSLLAWAAERVRPAFSHVAWQAFWQTSVEGKSPKVVAEDLGMSLGTVYQYKSRVVARIRREIEQVDDSGKPFDARS